LKEYHKKVLKSVYNISHDINREFSQFSGGSEECIHLILQRFLEDVMKKFVSILLLVLMISGLVCSNLQAAPLFPDVPDVHWARDAVADLAAKGILEGYPDGTFKGDRAATRWELAISIQRLLGKMEAEHASFATKADLETIRVLAGQLKDEIEALGVSLTRLEQQIAAVDTRVTDLERIRFYGFVQGNVVSQNVTGDQPEFGTAASPVVDWTTGRLLVKGTATTNLAKLGTVVNASRTTSFGTEFAAYTSLGDEIISHYWGVTPPYLSNPFTSTAAPVPGMQPKDNKPWTRMTLDRFWYRYRPNDTLITLGSFNVERADRLVLRGQRNPNVNPPEILPFYGVNVKGNFSSRPFAPWSYEVSHSRLPDASYYSTNMLHGSLNYNYERLRARAHYVIADNNRYSDGISYPPGHEFAPRLPRYPLAPGNAIIYWRDRDGNITNPLLGPQRMGLAGIDFDYTITDEWTAFVKGAISTYDPDTTNLVFDRTATGKAFVGGVRARYDRLNGSLQYQYASANYDPFVLQYPIPTGIPVFLPFSTYYSNYYQLHDYLSFPSNRHGAKLVLGYNFSDRTRVDFNAGYLQQVKPSTIENFTTVGHIEPLFPYLQTSGSTVRGYVGDWGLRLRHTLSDRWRGGVGYYNYMQRRRTPEAIDSIDLKQDLAYLNLGYSVTPAISLYGNFYYINYKGHLGLANVSFKNYIPSVTAEAALTPSVKMGLSYRLYNFQDKLNANQDWRANQWILDWRWNF
jgi:hypothetical protein